MLKLLGEEEFNKLRRAWDYPVPNGETLKMVYERVAVLFEYRLPLLKAGKHFISGSWQFNPRFDEIYREIKRRRYDACRNAFWRGGYL